MKKITILIVLALTLITSCKNDKKHEIATPEPVLTILQKVAYAHGFESWKNVDELKFTFNVDRDTTHFERDWSWKPKTNEVSGRSFGESISYNRNALDSTSIKSNGAFVNAGILLATPMPFILGMII